VNFREKKNRNAHNVIIWSLREDGSQKNLNLNISWPLWLLKGRDPLKKCIIQQQGNINTIDWYCPLPPFNNKNFALSKTIWYIGSNWNILAWLNQQESIITTNWGNERRRGDKKEKWSEQVARRFHNAYNTCLAAMRIFDARAWKQRRLPVFIIK
jgi:hypothetical protein